MNTNIFKPVSLFSLLLATVVLSACSSGAGRLEKHVIASDAGRSRLLLARIQEINGRAVDSYSARFTVEGAFGKNKFNSVGEARFNRNPRMARFSFFDIIFKSPLTVMVQDGAALKLYFPAEKTLYVDNADSMKLRNYAAIDIDFALVHPLTAGQIPLLDGFSIKHALVDESDPNRCYLVLENGDYFQTIGFNRDVPDRILFISKSSGKKTEFYLEKPLVQGGGLFYRTVRMFAPENGGRLTVSFSEVQYGITMDAATVLKIKLDRGAKIIDMTRTD